MGWEEVVRGKYPSLTTGNLVNNATTYQLLATPGRNPLSPDEAHPIVTIPCLNHPESRKGHNQFHHTAEILIVSTQLICPLLPFPQITSLKAMILGRPSNWRFWILLVPVVDLILIPVINFLLQGPRMFGVFQDSGFVAVT